MSQYQQDEMIYEFDRYCRDLLVSPILCMISGNKDLRNKDYGKKQILSLNEIPPS